MRLLYGHDRGIAHWVSKRVPGLDRGFGECRTIGVMDGDELVFAAVYHNWHPEHGIIEISGAGTTPRFLTKPVLKEIFGYPFRIGCQMVVMRVSEKNERLHRQLHLLGFRSHLIPRLRGRDEGEFIFTLTDDTWFSGKYMRSTNGKTPRAAAA